MSGERAAEVAHRPVEVTAMDGMPMVKCSCDGDSPRNVRWQSAYWLREHWQGTQAEGVDALNASARKQGREARRG